MFYCQPDIIIVKPQPGKAAHTFHDRFLQSDHDFHDFQLMIHSNVLATMHGFRDIEVVLPTGYDVIVRPPPGALYFS